MHYYKILNENGNIKGIAEAECEIEDENAVEISCEEYVEICERFYEIA